VPSCTAEVLRARLVVVADEDLEHLLFLTRNHTPLTTDNVRCRLRAALEGNQVIGVTPHSFRRTVATYVDRAGGSDPRRSVGAHFVRHHQTHYIEPNEETR
jgi:integrase